MKNLKSLSNEVLLQNTQALVAEERKLTTQVLWHLYEIQRLRLYAERGFGSLFEYAVQALGYSEAAAGRRISAMRLLVEVPEIEPALQKGDVSLSTLSTIQHFFQRKEEPVSREEKKELAKLDPVAAMPAEKERIVSPTQTEIRFVADDSLMEKLQQIRERDGHVLKDGTYLQLLHRMADLVLKQLDPVGDEKKKDKKAEMLEIAPPAELKTPSGPRAIPAALRRVVWKRDQGRCSYISPDGRRCTSKHALEIDHKIPIAFGGQSTPDNLQLLCRAHNQYKAIRQLGPTVMRPYLRM